MILSSARVWNAGEPACRALLHVRKPGPLVLRAQENVRL